MTRLLSIALLLTLPTSACASGPTDARPRPQGWWHSKHQRIVEQVSHSHPRLVFYGDSITEAWAHEGRGEWQRQLARWNALNAGIGGDQTSHLLWRLRHGAARGIQPQVAVVLIGVNNIFRTRQSAAAISRGVRAVVHELRQRLPRTQVLLLGLFPAGPRPGALRDKIAAVNRRLAAWARGQPLTYLDLGSHFLAADGTLSRQVMHDYLHLTPRGYGIWARAMLPTLRRLMRRGRRAAPVSSAPAARPAARSPAVPRRGTTSAPAAPR